MVDVTAGSLTYEFKAKTGELQAGLAQARSQIQQVSRQAVAGSQEMQRGFEQTTRQAQRLGNQFSTLSLTVSSFASRMAATFVRELPQAIANATENLRKMQETARTLGVSFQSLQSLNKAGSSLGIDPAAMNADLRDLALKLSEAARNGGELAKFMQANGIALKDANGQARPFKEVFADIARLISTAGSEVDKLNALKLLGLSEEMLRVFEQSGDAVRKFATDAGGEIDDFQKQTLARYQELKADFEKIWESIKDTVINYLSEIKHWAFDVAESISAAFRDIARGIDAAVASGKRAIGQAAETVGLGGKAGTSDFEYRQEALQIGRQRILDMRAASERETERNRRTLGDITIGGASGSIEFPGKTTKAHKEAQDAVKSYIESLRVAEETAKADLDNWKLGNIEREKAVALAKADSAAKKEGRSLTEAERSEIEARAASTGTYKDKLEELREAQQRLNAVTREFQSAVSNALEDIILRGGKAKDVLADLARQLASTALRQGINSLFGDTSGKSQGGGLLSGLLSKVASSFGGFFADGGNLGAGKWGIAGERGAEIIHGPASITPFGAMGSSQNVSVNVIGAPPGTQARETTDSRGGRKIDVILGEQNEAWANSPSGRRAASAANGGFGRLRPT